MLSWQPLLDHWCGQLGTHGAGWRPGYYTPLLTRATMVLDTLSFNYIYAKTLVAHLMYGLVGWLIPKPSKIPPTFCFPKSHKNPEVGGWVHTFGKTFKKRRFFGDLPLVWRSIQLNTCSDMRHPDI